MSVKKLTYFAGRGRGELIRLIFAAVNEKFEDNRISTEWCELKPKIKYGRLPVLFLEDGREMNESLAIARYLGRINNLYGNDDWDAYLVDRAIDTIMDLFVRVEGAIFEENATVKEVLLKNLKEKHVHQCLQNLTKYIDEGQGDFLAGVKASLADFELIIILDYLPEMRATYPKLDNAYKKTVEAYPGILNHLINRPADIYPLKWQ